MYSESRYRFHNQLIKFMCSGRSDRGSTVYAGMSKSGNLIAIKEWRFAAKLDKKGKEVKSSAFGGGDSLTLEGLMKLVSLKVFVLFTEYLPVVV